MIDQSPIKKRSVLTQKNINAKSSVRKEKVSSSQGSPKQTGHELEAQRRSPIKESSGSPLKTVNQFTFHKETPEERTLVLMNQVLIAKERIQDENDAESVKENLEQDISPKRSTKAIRKKHRHALGDLSIDEYAGYIQYKGSMKKKQLTLHIGHPTKLPSFVTPPRNYVLKQYFSTNTLKRSKGRKTRSQTTEDICEDKKAVRKLEFAIHEDRNKLQQVTKTTKLEYPVNQL
ncbi:Acm1p Ecym_3004 [Eremothecium cymbalariae DBVPG|uniref:Uncharacterized protein n=1 Tax=Eremothecium cymbalariae (strain CBS 270.75 / DBVPG 7215 / KCTC 17166 / NRRL Y-17582) TaxID=931890 RepID=G8JQV4_ERECY|nr:Hypothetical protein Ecym_3004 [Eremothecium cymbalariae DBVPG\